MNISIEDQKVLGETFDNATICQPSAAKSFMALAYEYALYAAANKADSTVHRDNSRLRLLRRVFGKWKLKDIGNFDIERFKQCRRGQVKPATVNRELALLSHMFHKAVDWGYLESNPLQCVQLFKESPGRIRYLSDDERERLLEECRHSKSTMLYSIVLTALLTGLRKSELQNLVWDDVDWSARIQTIVVRETKNNESRHIPISRTLLPVLRALWNQYPHSTYIFAKPDGTAYGNWRRAFESACRRANVKNFRFHDLRHTFASCLGMAGYNAYIIKALMGHKTLEMSARYTHIADDQLKAAVDGIGVRMVQLSLRL